MPSTLIQNTILSLQLASLVPPSIRHLSYQKASTPIFLCASMANGLTKTCAHTDTVTDTHTHTGTHAHTHTRTRAHNAYTRARPDGANAYAPLQPSNYYTKRMYTGTHNLR